ncbi:MULTISPECIES: LysR family transcriptional regulator [unclassified Paenibacillus]|uniref:LysR family transcriptional regulator n=1 Tax=unclassified Paenibacillus TaxID=185978 RepID=UPI002F3EFB1D
MELNDLVIFEAVALHGSVSKAAEQLNYVQSNVTGRIKRLELELQTTLFERHKRGMILNTDGKRLLEHAREILQKVDEVKRMFVPHDSPCGILDIGIIETVIALPGILHAYYSKYPNVELSLSTGVTEHLLQDVLTMKLDGAFVTGPITHPQIDQIDVIQERLMLVTKESQFSVEDITKKPLLLYNKGCGYRGRLESWMKVEGIVPKQIMEFGTFGTIIGSVAAGIGITILPESSVAQYVAEKQVYAHAIPKPFHDITTVFIRRKEAYVTSTLQSFMDEIDRATRTG